MQKIYKKVLFIFRRDLRLDDNTCLLKALDEASCVIPCFIFDPRQIEHNEYKSDNAIQFILESLDDLDEQLKKHKSTLYRFHGKAEDVVELLIKKEHIDAVYINHDYTPFSKKRDHEIEKICIKNNITFNAFHDLLLNEPEAITKKDGKPYCVFTPFFKKAIKQPVVMPVSIKTHNFFTEFITYTIKNYPKKLTWKPSEQYCLPG